MLSTVSCYKSDPASGERLSPLAQSSPGRHRMDVDESQLSGSPAAESSTHFDPVFSTGFKKIKYTIYYVSLVLMIII